MHNQTLWLLIRYMLRKWHHYHSLGWIVLPSEVKVYQTLE